jgi:ParB family transcriptional regulator, chromosome partitioning protein
MNSYYGGSEIGIFERLPLRQLRHPRRSVRESLGDIGELVASIRAHGLLEPIVVRPIGDSYEVVAGNRRMEACRRLGKKSVACHVVAMDDASSYELSLIENIQRQNLNPLEEALAFRKYVDDYGFGGLSRLARTIGKSESYVSRRIALLDLPDSVTKSMKEGSLSLIIAQELIPLPDPEASSLARLAVDNALSRGEVRDIARASRSDLAGGPYFERPRDGDPKSTDRALNKAMTLLRVCLMRLDATIESLDADDWLLEEALLDYRRGLHAMVDRLIRLKVRSKRLASSGESLLSY